MTPCVLAILRNLLQPSWFCSIVRTVGLVMMLRHVLQGDFHQIRKVSIRRDVLPERGAKKDKAVCDQVPRSIAIVLSPEQKEQLKRMNARQVVSANNNTARWANSNGL